MNDKTITLLIIVKTISAKVEVRPMIGTIVGGEGEKKREGDQTGQTVTSFESINTMWLKSNLLPSLYFLILHIFSSDL